MQERGVIGASTLQVEAGGRKNLGGAPIELPDKQQAGSVNDP